MGVAGKFYSEEIALNSVLKVFHSVYSVENAQGEGRQCRGQRQWLDGELQGTWKQRCSNSNQGSGDGGGRKNWRQARSAGSEGFAR